MAKGMNKMIDIIKLEYRIDKKLVEARTGIILTDKEYNRVCEILPFILRDNCRFDSALCLAARDAHDK